MVILVAAHAIKQWTIDLLVKINMPEGEPLSKFIHSRSFASKKRTREHRSLGDLLLDHSYAINTRVPSPVRIVIAAG